MITKFEHKTFESGDLQNVHDFSQDADIVEGPDELYAIVAELWPNLLHKIKPPLSLMH